MTNLKLDVLKKLKAELIEQVSMVSVDLGEVANDEAIFGPDSKLGLDSLDALELIVLLEQNFGLKVKGKSSSTVIFKSFNDLGDYIIKNTAEEILINYVKE